MKIYVVVDWHARILSLSEDDNAALNKFRTLAISAEPFQTVVFEEMDMATGESKTLMAHRNGTVTAYDDSLSGMASDMNDERSATITSDDGDEAI